MNIFGVILMGCFAGFFVATTGMLKDVRYEPFRLKKYVRSPIIAVLWAIVGFVALEVQDHFVLLGFSAGFERLTIEVWKAFVRKKPAKFKSATRDTGWINECPPS